MSDIPPAPARPQLTPTPCCASMVGMFDRVVAAITGEASGERAFESVSWLSRFHRIQASPGFRHAATYCADVMLESCEDARIIHYPAEDNVRFWHFPSFDEWNGRRGILKVTAPRELAGKVADFEACPISLIQRSAATPDPGLETEIVYAGSGENPGDYKRARGKIAIVDAYAPHTVYDAAVKAGVRGIVIYRQRPLDPVRGGAGLPGIRPYCSFWWDERELFGFVLTPEDGERLVSYLKSAAARKHAVKAWAIVDGERYPGTIEVVTSLLPGREEKEVVLVAHLCHPQPSAGDNASGVAVALEVHRLLSKLVRAGKLPEPRYGVRFLLVPEMSGTFAYLARERKSARNLILGLNLDMVGQKQDLTGSTLCVEKPPLPSSSFAPYLLSELAATQFSVGMNPGGTAPIPVIRWTGTPFSGGSDHAILSDPAVGVPTPMLIQWPDRYYHTSGDRPENISPELLGKIAVVAGTYLCLCAVADESTLLKIVSITGRGLRKEFIDGLSALQGTPADDFVTPRYKARVLGSAGKKALRAIGRLAPESTKLAIAVAEEEAALHDCIRREAAMVVRRLRRETAGAHLLRPGRRKAHSRMPCVLASREKVLRELERVVVKRLLPGPVDPRGLMRQLTPARRARFRKRITKHDGSLMIGTAALYWADGRRNLAQINRLVAVELGYSDPAFLKFYFGLLRDTGFVEYRPR